MLRMSTDASQDVTVVGRRLRRRVLLALGLFGVLPVLVLAYAVHRYFSADVSSLRGGNRFALQGLVFFSLRLEEEISRFRRFSHPVSVVLLDLDGFKSVNDEFGHAVGDETLREIAQILMKHSRGINVVSRYGGDEFAILLVETSKAGARLYADRIRQVVATFPFSHGKAITASFGVRSEEHTSELQSLTNLVCRLLLEK